MKFYGERILYVVWNYSGFNSQRDEILPLSFASCSFLPRFQFPTGWNSTFLGRARKPPPFCFNSQRDEILLAISIMLAFDTCSFNSQRDEILRWASAFVLLEAIVSIPNGMKFYERFCVPIKDCRMVSIPNGMKFYRFNCVCSHGEGEFQFPTGWNSTLLSFDAPWAPPQFQFPTGWNSTHRLSMLYFFLRSFNSQRDEILLYSRSYQVFETKCFNSQRDEILLQA